MSELRKFLGRHKRVAIDTNVFVYLLQDSERYGRLAESVFAWIKLPGNSAAASTIVVTELLVPLYKDGGSLEDLLSGKIHSLEDQPYRPSGQERAQEFLILLAHYPNLDWIAADFGIADLAAQYRASYGLKTPDALHAATAVSAGATGFITNDGAFDRVQEFETLQLEKLL